MDEITQITQAISALEAQRAQLGDAVVDTALIPLREKLAALQHRPAAEQRKLVTVLFSDLVDFTALSSTMDPEDMREIINAYFKLWSGYIEKYGGSVEKYIGDAVMAVFGLATSHEDDPERAIRASLEMRQALAGLNQEIEAHWGVQLAMRVGIHTGPVMVSLLGERKGQDFVVVGDAVNLASRLQAVAPVGGIIISHDTYRHARGVFDMEVLEPVKVKGKPEPIQVYLILQAKQRTFREASRGVEGIETRMIGRQAELQQLKDALEQTIQARKTRVVMVVGEVGIGKSRLMAEFDQWIDQLPQVVRYFKGRASPSMQNMPYSLLRDLFSFRFQILDSDSILISQEKFERGIGEFEYNSSPSESQMRAHIIGQLLGFKFENSPYLPAMPDDPRTLRDRALTYLIDYFNHLAAIRPIVVLLEDIHWADDSSLDLLDQLVDGLPGLPLLVVCAARPSYFERMHQWGQDNGEGVVSHIKLKPLSRRNNLRLVKEILKKVDQLPDALRKLIVDRAEGNPYFTEELVKMLIEDGVILKKGERWQVNPVQLASTRVPPTLVEVLQARFDTLSLEERVALQRASVLGKIFWDEAIRSMERAEDEQISFSQKLNEVLQRLSAREMIFPQKGSAFDDTEEYHFKHALLRDVTYETVLKRLRRVYHACAAAWLEAVTQRTRRSDEYAALIAEHYEQAEEWQRSRDWYLRAGIMATDHFANAEAIRCITHCLELWPSQDLAGKADLLIRRVKLYDLIANRLAQKSDLEALRALAEELDGGPGPSGDSPAIDEKKPAGSWQAQSSLQWWHYYDALGEAQAATAAAQQAAAFARAAGDREAEALASLLGGATAWKNSDFPAARTKLEQALALARQAQLPKVEADCLRNLGIVHEYQGDYAGAQAHYESALKTYQETGNERGISMTLNSLGSLLVDQGHYKQAQSYFESSLALKRKIGHRRAEHITLHNLGIVADQLGQYLEARQYLEQVLRFASEIKDREGEADALLMLGTVSMHLGDFRLAQAQLEQSLALFRELEVRASEAGCILTMGKLALYQGQFQETLEYGQQALTLAQELALPRDVITANLIMGRALAGSAQVEPALELFSQALGAAQELGVSGPIQQARAGLAQAHLAAGRVGPAMQAVEQILAYLGPEKLVNCAEENLDTLLRIEEPFWVLLTCCQTLNAGGDPRAAAILSCAGQLLDARVDVLADESLQRAFLAIPIHQKITQLRQKSTH